MGEWGFSEVGGDWDGYGEVYWGVLEWGHEEIDYLPFQEELNAIFLHNFNLLMY